MLFVLALTVCSFREDVEALAKQSKGRAELSRRLFGTTAADEDNPFESAKDAAEWLARIDRYDPITPEFRSATALFFARERTDEDADWFLDHSPELGNLIRPVGIFRRLVHSARRGDLGHDGWPALKSTVLRYVTKISDGPLPLVGIATSVALLQLVATTPELAIDANTQAMTSTLRARLTSEKQRLNRKAANELRVSEALRAEVREVLRAMEH